MIQNFQHTAMIKKFVFVFLLLAMTTNASAAPSVIFETSKGNFTVALDPEKAPVTVKNFLEYVDSHFYDGLVFHRVIPGFMVQGGGMDAELKQKQGRAPIKIESSNGLKNVRGSVAMARTSDPNSASSQFFVNLVDNSFLDYKDSSPQGVGYTVFGKVTSGLEVIDEIAKVKTGTKGMYSDVPLETVTIKSAKKVE